MPTVLTVIEKITSCWVLPKRVTLLEPSSNTNPGPETPWSWKTYNDLLIYWDDEGKKHTLNGDVEQELVSEDLEEGITDQDSDDESESESE